MTGFPLFAFAVACFVLGAGTLAGLATFAEWQTKRRIRRERKQRAEQAAVARPLRFDRKAPVQWRTAGSAERQS